ncbi:MAG: hypothetical protein QOI25_3739, partial [Mycobacterium sp.]|nr:hypothetical protein [Mycobacterium sp.]
VARALSTGCPSPLAFRRRSGLACGHDELGTHIADVASPLLHEICAMSSLPAIPMAASSSTGPPSGANSSSSTRQSFMAAIVAALHAEARMVDGADPARWPERPIRRSFCGVEDEADCAWTRARLRPLPRIFDTRFTAVTRSTR